MISIRTLHHLVVGCFAGLARYSIQRPKRVIAIAILFTAAIAPGAARLALRTDGHALVSPEAPEVRYDKAIREEFGIKDLIVVLIHSRHPDGIYNPDTLDLVRQLTGDLAKLEGIKPSDIVSLATEHGFRNRPGTMDFQTFLEAPRNSKPELDQLRDDLRRIGLYNGTLVSFDERSTALLIGVPEGADRTALYQKITDLASRRGPDEVSVTGAPVAEALLGIHILEDLGVPKSMLGASANGPPEEGARRWPSNLHEIRTWIARHIGLVPISVIVMALIFQFSFHRAAATLLPLVEVGACLIFVFGLMGWCGVPIYLTIAVVPVLLTAMVVTDEIHVYSRYFALLHERPGADHRDLVQETMDEMVCPVVNTTLTTAIGFVSFAFSPIRPVVAFGAFTAIGVLFSLFWSLSVIPAMLAAIPPNWLLARNRAGGETKVARVQAWFSRFAARAVARRVWILSAIVLIIAASPLGLRKLVIQDSWVNGFDPESQFSRTTRLVNDQFHGMHLLYVTLDGSRVLSGTLPVGDITYGRFAFPSNLTQNPDDLAGSRILFTTGDASGSPGYETWQSIIESATPSGDKLIVTPLKQDINASFWLRLQHIDKVRYQIIAQPFLQPATMQTLADFGAFIESRRQFKVGKAISAADYVATTRFMVHPSEPGSHRIPSSDVEMRLMWRYYGMVRGAEQLRQIVNTNFTRSLLTIFLKDANFIDTAKLMDDIRSYERSHLEPRGLRIGFAGDVAVSQSLIGGIVKTQMQSLFGSLVGIYAVTALLGRSLKWGVYAVIPCAVSVLVNFAAMGWLDIPLGVATSMFAAMTLGIGVDFAIHVLEGFQSSRAKGLSPDAALSESMARTGPAVVINTLAIALGFGVLMLSQVPANSRLGALTILGIVNCLVASLLLLPVLLHWWPLPKDSG